MGFENKPILEEHTVPERRGLLGGRSIETTTEGKLNRTMYAAVCDFCGHYPLDQFVVCRKCKGRLCDECSNWLDGRPYDRACLMEILPVSSGSYKVLMCLEAGIRSTSKISDLTRISKDDIKASLAHLNEMKLVETKGILAFLERKVTAEGVRALSAYKKVYRNDEDIRQLEQQLVEEEKDGE